MPAGTPPCSAGTLGTVLAPGASTTDRVCHKSWSVCTTNPPLTCRTDVTVEFARTGAADSRSCSPTFGARRRWASAVLRLTSLHCSTRFYIAATQTLLRHDAVIDKLIGDEVMAFFVRGISGPHYRRRAVLAGMDLLKAVGYGSPGGPWLEVGVAVNAGVAYVGNVGGAVVDFTALGDPVNVAARMQQHANGGELLVASEVADDLMAKSPRRALNLRGHEQPIDAFVLGV